MPFMCMTCDKRPVFEREADAVGHMKSNPFHQMVYYDDSSMDSALEKVKKNLGEQEM